MFVKIELYSNTLNQACSAFFVLGKFGKIWSICGQHETLILRMQTEHVYANCCVYNSMCVFFTSCAIKVY
jgi:hypothetical protein